ncbi:hypothetical protein O9G_002164 [Rozella allomycis CSF55]|uniref:RING-type domain-containing protein n=1 Tax=Rozella allomycis (strain CSF55) TaxID=988480 RepID=A0A075AQ40_ROZAC|nr:hypothetical protein O9G_002164 [Rozella allomycis CSF55]|eukprot:EPZ32323.1 hypothetical protein O9G_002164 [Rozella allomycis CSF55]
MRDLQNRYPDATPDELASGDRVCIICRENMDTAKRWIERHNVCPTCRQPLDSRPANTNTNANENNDIPNAPNNTNEELLRALQEHERIREVLDNLRNRPIGENNQRERIQANLNNLIDEEEQTRRYLVAQIQYLKFLSNRANSMIQDYHRIQDEILNNQNNQ